MAKFESGAQRKPENVWGHSGEYAEEAQQTDLSNFKIASVPAANDTGVSRGHTKNYETKNVIETDTALVAKILGGADFSLSQNEASFVPNTPDQRGPNDPTEQQLDTARRIYGNKREDNIALVENPAGEVGNLTDDGEVPGDIQTAEARYEYGLKQPASAPTPSKVPGPSAQEVFGVSQPWTRPAPPRERQPEPKKPFWKFW